MEKLKTSVCYMVTILKRSQIESPKLEKVPDINRRLGQLVTTHAELMKWAGKLDLVAKAPSKRKPRVT